MATKPVTLHLPENLYELYRQKAEQAQRSVEDELLEAVSTAAPADELNAGLAKEIENLKLLNDKALWKTAAQSHLTSAQAKKLAQLNRKQQQLPSAQLSAEEAQLKQELLDQYEHHLLIRSQALLLLKERGFDISSLLKVS
jgi:hypothetical protein